MSPAAPTPQASETSRRLLRDGRPSGERSRTLLLSLIKANPGVHILRASSVLGLNWNTTLHHVRRLEAEGRVVSRKVQGRLCLFDRQGGAAANRLAPVLLRDERNHDIARMLLAQPGMNQRTLAQETGLAASVIHRRLVRLEEAGLVQRVAQSRDVAVFGTDALVAHVSRPAVPDSAVPFMPTGTPSVPTWMTASVEPVTDGAYAL